MPRASTYAATSSAASSVDSAAAKLVPAKIKAKGTVVVASDASYAPDEFVGPDGHTIEGFDPDLARAAFAKLGLKVNFINASFDTISCRFGLMFFPDIPGAVAENLRVLRPGGHLLA